MGGNFSYNHNKVVFQDEPARAVPWQQTTGHPYNAWLMYRSIGVFADQGAVDAYPHWNSAKPGDLIFEDVSKDGVINGDDRVLIDEADVPEIFYGINSGCNLERFYIISSLTGTGEILKAEYL